MSRTATIALIKRFFDAINSADAEAAANCLHEDAVRDTGGGAREFGRQAFREFLVYRQAETGEQIGDAMIMANDDGTRAAAEFTRRGRRRDASGIAGGGESYSVSGGMFFAVEDGSIVRITPAGALADP